MEDEKQYEAEVARLVAEGELNPNDWVDFGGLGQFSASEYFGASLWQLYKGIDSPYKSVMKILLLETYAQEYPNAHLIARQFKEDLLSGRSTAAHHFDPYIAILERISQYLTAHSEFKRLDFVRSCFLREGDGRLCVISRLKLAYFLYENDGPRMGLVKRTY